jgi:hypothetical protein
MRVIFLRPRGVDWGSSAIQPGVPFNAFDPSPLGRLCLRTMRPGTICFTFPRILVETLQFERITSNDPYQAVHRPCNRMPLIRSVLAGSRRGDAWQGSSMLAN